MVVEKIVLSAEEFTFMKAGTSAWFQYIAQNTGFRTGSRRDDIRFQHPITDSIRAKGCVTSIAILTV
jgi:hypothetical protein